MFLTFLTFSSPLFPPQHDDGRTLSSLNFFIYYTYSILLPFFYILFLSSENIPSPRLPTSAPISLPETQRLPFATQPQPFAFTISKVPLRFPNLYRYFYTSHWDSSFPVCGACLHKRRLRPSWPAHFVLARGWWISSLLVWVTDDSTMGSCFSSESTGDADQKKRSQQIDRKLEEDSRRLRKECKILLLGR
jgi:hypothetical protein